MWHVDFNIVDKVRDIEKRIHFVLKNFMHYGDLFDLIPKIYSEYREGENITLLLYNGYRKKLIREFSRFVRHCDIIEVIISTSSFLLCNVESYEIYFSEEIVDLYRFYFDSSISYEIFLVKVENNHVFLIDVLDSGLQTYNDCVNRLIRQYNY
jgi:hypothetical protein